MNRLRIEAIDELPISELHYLNARRGGGTAVERLPILRAQISTLAGEIDAVVACGDLQGIVPRPELATLLGVAVAEALEELAFDGILPPAERTGIVLTGDLYSVPEANERGGYGDVAEVWRAFAERFAWVVGVAGNHDDVSRVPDLSDNVHLLDGEVVELDGLRFGGVSGIIGTKAKPGRRPEAAQLELLDRVVASGVDVLIVHEGPHGDADQKGNAAIRSTIESLVPLTLCGHCHWMNPLAELDGGQVLNVDARVLVLTRNETAVDIPSDMAAASRLP
jgi:Icc-related predicted phosphoesterase